MIGKYSLFAVALFSCRCLYAGACTVGTLASYEALPSGPTGGCTIGNGIFVYNFTFNVVSTSGGAVDLSASNINVAPTSVGVHASLGFAASGFSVTSGQAVTYLIGYTYDPFDDIVSMDDLEDPPLATGTGSSSITSVGCLNQAFVSNTCGTSTVSVNVFDNASTSQLSNLVSFSPVQILGIQDTIALQGGTGSAIFDGFTNESSVPEPATWLTCVTCLALLALRRKLFRSRPEASGVRFEHLS
jgi:hypothetical protein